jgi:type VI secretion system protein ImpH
MQAILAQAPRMNFFRFCQLLELAAPGMPGLGVADTPAPDLVRFRSVGRLGFPSREIAAIEWDDGCGSNGNGGLPACALTVRTTFLGLYGVDASMPAYFIDEIAQNRDGAEPLAAFLDLFHHRVVTQFYRVGRKYRYPLGFQNDGGDAVSRCLLSLVGLGLGMPPSVQELGPRSLLAMLGLASQRTRTAEGLVGVLQHAVPDATITVQEFYPVWIALNDADPTPLGDYCLLGRGFYDRINAVRVVIAPRQRASVLGLMPGQPLHRQLMAVLQFYLGYEMQAHLELQVWPALLPRPQLNSNQVRLGYTTALPRACGAPPSAALARVRLGTWTGRQPA